MAVQRDLTWGMARKLDKGAISQVLMRAYNRLSENDKQELRIMAECMVDRLKHEHPNIRFSMSMAMELILTVTLHEAVEGRIE
jgi:hypothetical protein